MTSKTQKKYEQRVLEAFKHQMTTYEGRLVLTFILEKCHVYSISNGGENTHTTAYLEGERNIGLQILQILEQFPEQHLEMLRQVYLDKAAEKNQLNKNQEKDNEDNEFE